MPPVDDYIRHGTKPGPGGRIVWKRDPNLAKGFVETELWQYVRRITCPTIYVLGGRSTIVPPEMQEQLKRTLPKAEIVVMPGLGHYPDLRGSGVTGRVCGDRGAVPRDAPLTRRMRAVPRVRMAPVLGP